MVFVVTDKCVKCKYTDCVVVCPVDCFYEGEDMVVINPDECIDCGVCEPECPIEAIKPESEELIDFVELNRKYSAEWPNIIEKKDPHPEVEKYKDIEDKKDLLEFFDEE